SGNIVTPNTTYTATNGISISGGNVISPVYGTTAGTIAQGNDSRINNGQTAYDWGDFRDYGLGINPTITNADLITESRFFSTSDAHAFGYGSGIHLGRYEPSGVRAGQLHIGNAGSGSEPVVKVRSHNSSGWGTIRTLWHNGNLRSNAQNDARYLQLTGGRDTVDLDTRITAGMYGSGDNNTPNSQYAYSPYLVARLNDTG